MYFCICSTIKRPTSVPSVPIPALTVIFISLPRPAPAPADNGITASGPCSPTKATVGSLTIPPLANLGICGKSGGFISIPKKLKPKPLFSLSIKPLIESITLLNTNFNKK